MDLTVSIEKRRHAFLCLRSLSVDQLSDQLLFLRYAIAAAAPAAASSASIMPVCIAAAVFVDPAVVPLLPLSGVVTLAGSSASMAF